MRHSKRRGIVLAVVGVLMVIALVAAACGEEATPTPAPATATPRPLPTATTAPQPTATPVPAARLRPIEEWTLENPATLEEIEAQLEKHRGESFVYASWGGPDQAAEQQAWLDPFQEKFGIQIIQDSPVVYARLRAMAETGNIQWDVVNGSDQGAWTNIAANAVEKLDFSIIDNRTYAEGQKNEYFGPGIFFSNVLLYSESAVQEKWGGQRPQTMADVFDVVKFPGFRSFARPEWGWKTTLRFALLADNPTIIPKETGSQDLARLSDEQVSRAFEVLDTVKPSLTVWWENGSDCPSLLLSGDLDICTTWNGTAQSYVDEGEPIYICWECGHLVNGNPWYLIRGLKEQNPEKYELANLFLAWISFPENHARESLFITYGSTNLAASALYDGSAFDEIRDKLPTSSQNLTTALFSDPKWDGEHTAALAEKYLLWQTE